MDLSYSFIVGSGWFSDEKGVTLMGQKTNKHQLQYGGTRNTGFSKTWFDCILQLQQLPVKIFIADADSVDPLHTDVLRHPLVTVSKQTQNFGHGAVCESQNILCGWARGVLNGAMYAYTNSSDYFVYIEQDVQMVGKNIVHEIICHMKHVNKPICFGGGDETPQKLQQSLFVVSHDYLPTFMSRLILYNNNRCTEEHKYWQCFKDDLTFLPFRGGRQRKFLRQDVCYWQHR
jgi:hypothetical protein